MDSKLVIRADASSRMGTGHVMRCLALAQAWQDAGGKTIFVMCPTGLELEARLRLEDVEIVQLPLTGGSIEDAMKTVEVAKVEGASNVVLDGYHFGYMYQNIIRSSAGCLLVVDDNADKERYCADIILNQNLSASAELYQGRGGDALLLLGTPYVMLRREYYNWQGWRREVKRSASRFLITLGGSDPDNVTLKVIHALKKVNIKELEAVVVVGIGNPHCRELELAAKKLNINIHIVRDVSNMPELMAWADVAVAAGGSTSWERAFMGLPSLIVVIADNQRMIAEEINKAGASLNLGWHEDISIEDIMESLLNLSLDFDLRGSMAQRSQELVDSKGSARIIRALIEKTEA